jgi:hypothetical protein
MVIRIIEGLLRIRRVQEKMQKPEGSAAAERRKKEGAPVWKSEELERARPLYTEADRSRIREIWSESLRGKIPDYNVVSSHIDSFFQSRSTEDVKTFAYYCLKHGFGLETDRARKIAEIVAANKKFFRGGVGRDDVINNISSDAKKIPEGPERNWVNIVLENPEKYRAIFAVFRRKPSGVDEFLTEEEWQRPPRRPPTPTT